MAIANPCRALLNDQSACIFCSAPEITAVSKPNKKPLNATVSDQSSNFLSSWCYVEALQTEFCSQIYPFAVANSTGSTYAFWDNGIEAELNKMPILVFGDEGGLHLVAKNILALVEQLTFDREIIVYEKEVYFPDDKDDDDYFESLYADESKAFVKQQFTIEPTNDPNKLIEKAQNSLKKSFDDWYAKYEIID